MHLEAFLVQVGVMIGGITCVVVGREEDLFDLFLVLLPFEAELHL